MKLFKGLFFTFFSIIFLTTSAMAAYTESPVADGGTISGKITFVGTPPPPATVPFSKFPQEKFCSQADSDGKGNRIRQDVKVKNGALSDVVVAIDKIEKGKAFKFAGTDVHADTCRFIVDGGPSKSVGVVVKKTEFRVTNNDADPGDPKTEQGVLHNPHGYDVKGAQSSTIFNKPLTTKGMTMKEMIKPVSFKKEDSFMMVQCDQHNFMMAWFLPVTNPYYAIVNEDGSFSIDQVPPGTYEIKAWHPQLGFVKQSIEVAAKGSATTNFEFKGK